MKVDEAVRPPLERCMKFVGELEMILDEYAKRYLGLTREEMANEPPQVREKLQNGWSKTVLGEGQSG